MTRTYTLFPYTTLFRSALVGQAVAEVVAHDAHRAHDVVEVHQRLAHAHHHHVGELALLVRHVAQVLRGDPHLADDLGGRSEEHTSELQSLMRISYAVFCLKHKKTLYSITIHLYTS